MLLSDSRTLKNGLLLEAKTGAQTWTRRALEASLLQLVPQPYEDDSS